MSKQSGTLSSATPIFEQKKNQVLRKAMQNKILSKEALQRLEAIHRLSQEYNRKIKKDHRKRLIELMKEHTSEIDELFQQDNPHYLTETGDLIILCMELLLENNQPIGEIMENCFNRYDKKLPVLLSKVGKDLKN